MPRPCWEDGFGGGCLYSSRVSNFLHDSPTQYYRSPRELMPHGMAGAWMAKL
ncbi:HAD-IG family 5'-nucleotidase [Archangium lipolyticum]|uniref:HAD-IG family 5'-nucleotidase n=1 Tax=Archangium lipolyticum TaxID=2970465 RepID=UPI002149B38B|nr:HAD-IG family 5'-nucleotidase [Archangium lipolyticum]